MLVVVPLGGLAVFFLLMQLSLSLPDVEGLKTFSNSQTTRVLARDGQVVATLFVEKRSPVPLAKISPRLVKALLAVEDSRFYQHGGVDWWGVGRAFWANTLLGRVDQGASTLTMQLARNRFLTQDLSYRRKIREMMLAHRIEGQFSKAQILELYLNNVYFGSGAYGVASAAKLYFGRGPGDLSLAQAALLAGLVQAPSRLSPLVDAQAALQRMETVLQRMRETGVIDADGYARALEESRRFRFKAHAPAAEPLLKHPYFTTYVIAQLAKEYSEEELYRGGLVVSTTLDVKLQRLAERELSDMMAAYGPGVNADSAALVLMENSSGAVRAMVGGRGWTKKNQFNRAWQALRQPGSSFKPFVYTAALQAGMTPDSLVDDSPVTYGNWSPRNADGSFRGRISLRQALRESRNVVSARLCHQVGAARVVELAQQLGVREKLEAHLAISLGACEVSVLSMATGYSTIASGGYFHQPMAITKVSSQDYRERLLPLPVITPEVSAQMLEMMLGVVRGGTGTAAQIEGLDVAGKTGTTDGSRDAWFVGCTPEYTLAVWVGNDNHAPMYDVYGGGLPARLWQRVMSQVPQTRKRFASPLRVGGRRSEEPAAYEPPPAFEVTPAPEPEVVEEEPLPPVIPWESPEPAPTAEEPEAPTPSPLVEGTPDQENL
ncbi:MAG: PBP1A family penicillin-binding protein [Candidatus Eremiobacteraeota bacterium]|nr:PBP1A family penicillin-binding protein [Candidatus Eremiobacteraeota bacterium]